MEIQHDATLMAGVPLLDAIEVWHGPRDELGRFFLLADGDARRLGVRLRLHQGLVGLAEANRAVRKSWGGPLIPNLDHVIAPPAADGTAFWISGHDNQGILVATQAARLTDMTATSLAEELTSLRLFYAEPGHRASRGSACLLSAEASCAAAAITGRVAYGGGLWCHESLRGRGMTAILPRIARNIAATLWDTHYHVSVMDQALTAKAVHGHYGYTNCAGAGMLQGIFERDIPIDLIWMDRVQLALDRWRYMEPTAGRAVPAARAMALAAFHAASPAPAGHA